MLVSPSGLRIHVYSRSGIENVKQIAIINPGLPSYIDKEFFQSAPVKDDTGYVILYYYGYWLSEGDFSPVSPQNSLVDCVQAIKKDNFIDAFSGDNVKTSHLAIERIIGYSFGANCTVRAVPLLSTKCNITNTKYSLVAPLVMVNKDELFERGVPVEIMDNFYRFNKAFVKFLRRGFASVLNGIENESWDKYFNGTDEDSKIIGNLQTYFSKKGVDVYCGKKDKSIPLEFINAIRVNPSIRIDIDDNSGHDKTLIYKAF